MSNRIAVMYLGRIIGISSKDAEIGNRALHPYTVSLLSVRSTRLRGERRDRKRTTVLRGHCSDGAAIITAGGCGLRTSSCLSWGKEEVASRIEPELMMWETGVRSACLGCRSRSDSTKSALEELR